MSGRRARILVADDDPDIRELLRACLTDEGHEVVAAHDGPAALDALHGASFDLALLDLEMPGLDGLSVLHHIKQDPATESMPVLLVTARTGADAAVEGLRVGATDYIRKPFDTTELLARVSNALRTKEILDRAVELNRDLQQAAHVDALTGIANRRYLELQLEKYALSAAARGRHLGVAVVDLDHFKVINDTYGHVFGDRVLCEVTQALASGVRRNDLLCRYGGEEFVVLMPDVREEGVVAVAERLCEVVRSWPVANPEGERLAVTVSVGFAWGEESDPQQLLAQADAALYEAKRQGRDRAVPA